MAKKWIEEYVEIDTAQDSSNPERKTAPPAAPTKKGTEPTLVHLAPASRPTKPSGGRFDRKRRMLAVDKKAHREQVQLFYALNQVLKANHMKKSVNCVQVLTRAKDTVAQLRSQQVEMEQTKKALLFKRAKLFEEFVQKLNCFPASVKKKALLETKEMLKKIKEQRQDPPPPPSLKTGPPPPPPPPPPAPTVSVPTAATATSQQQLQQQQGSAVAAPAPVLQLPQMPKLSPKPGHVAAPPPSGSPPLLPVIPKHQQQQQLAGGSTPYSDVTGLATVKKDGKVLRPMNAFMLWTKNYRRELIAKGIDGASVSKILADEWKKLTEDEKSKYSDEAVRLKSLHQIQHPNYK